MVFQIQSGIVCGREHIVFGINCQDSLQSGGFEVAGKKYYFGVVADGCGEGEKSETGAHLAVAFTAHHLELTLKDGVTMEKLPYELFTSLIHYLANITYYLSEEKRAAFIKGHLLFTLLGFLIGEKETIVFTLGDGVVVLNEEIHIIDEQNTPSYISYNLVAKRFLKKGSFSPNGFILHTFPTAKLDTLAVATDGFSAEKSVLETLLQLQVGESVQRKINLLSAKQKKFKDDAAIVIAKRVGGKSEGVSK